MNKLRIATPDISDVHRQVRPQISDLGLPSPFEIKEGAKPIVSMSYDQMRAAGINFIYPSVETDQLTERRNRKIQSGAGQLAVPAEASIAAAPMRG